MRDDPGGAREAAREHQVRLVPRGQEGSDDLSATPTCAERLAMMRPLALAAWSVAGLPLPTYTREQMPITIVRRR